MSRNAAIAEPISMQSASKPEIDPARVKVNSDGFTWRSLFVRLPEGMVADDLKEPGIWRKVQSSPRALRRFDQLLIVSYNEDWAAEAIVADGDGFKAVLCKPRLIQFPERYDRLFSDDQHRVV